jgi:hypothetical protein
MFYEKYAGINDFRYYLFLYILVDGDNIYDLKICDFAAATDADGEVYIYLTKDEQTKNHQDDPNSAQGRMYTRKGNIENEIIVHFLRSVSSVSGPFALTTHSSLVRSP